MNEDVRLRSWNWPANASISGKRSLSKIRSYSNVIRPPVNCHSFFSSLFFFLLFHSSSPRPFFPFCSLRCILQFMLSHSLLSLLPLIPLLLFRMQIIRHSADGLPRKFTAVLIPLGAEVLSETKAQGRLESAKKRGSFFFFPPPFLFASVSDATAHVSKRSYLDPDRTTSCRNFGRPATRSAARSATC